MANLFLFGRCVVFTDHYYPWLADNKIGAITCKELNDESTNTCNPFIDLYEIGRLLDIMS